MASPRKNIEAKKRRRAQDCAPALKGHAEKWTHKD